MKIRSFNHKMFNIINTKTATEKEIPHHKFYGGIKQCLIRYKDWNISRKSYCIIYNYL